MAVALIHSILKMETFASEPGNTSFVSHICGCSGLGHVYANESSEMSLSLSQVSCDVSGLLLGVDF